MGKVIKMDGFELNKIACSVLLSLLIIMGIDVGVDHLLKPAHHGTKEDHQIVFAPEAISSETSIQNSNLSTDTIEPIEELIKFANIDAGKKIAKKCLQCHT